MEAPLCMCVHIHSLMYEKKEKQKLSKHHKYYFLVFSFWFRVKIHLSVKTMLHGYGHKGVTNSGLWAPDKTQFHFEKFSKT